MKSKVINKIQSVGMKLDFSIIIAYRVEAIILQRPQFSNCFEIASRTVAITKNSYCHFEIPTQLVVISKNKNSGLNPYYLSRDFKL